MARSRPTRSILSVLLLAPLVGSILATSALSASAHAQDSSRLTERLEARVHEAADLPNLRYRIFEPTAAPGAESGSDEEAPRPDPAAHSAPYPLVLFLHGAGERGDDNARQLIHGVGDFVSDAAQAANPCFVVAPQCPRGVYWHVAPEFESVVDLVRTLAARDDVDASRIYVTGLSMGGYGTWALLKRHPDLFAAAMPICGRGEPDAAEAMRGVPIWAFHGGADNVVPPEGSRAVVAALRALGAPVRYTEYEGVGHNSWSRTYASSAVRSWLLSQRRTPPARVELKNGARIAFLGDSITQAGARRPGGYVNLAAASLKEARPDLDFTFIGAGISGNKIADLKKRLDKDVLGKDPTLVAIYIGINDVWHWNRNRGTREADFATGLAKVVDRIQAAGAEVLLCTPTVIGEKTDGSNPRDAMLDDYAQHTRALAAARGLPLLDLRLRFQTWLDDHNPDNAAKGVLTSDRVHLNETGNRFVADAFLEAFGVDVDQRER